MTKDDFYEFYEEFDDACAGGEEDRALEALENIDNATLNEFIAMFIENYYQMIFATDYPNINRDNKKIAEIIEATQKFIDNDKQKFVKYACGDPDVAEGHELENNIDAVEEAQKNG